MSVEQNGHTIELVEDGHVVAAADLEPLDDPTVIRASLHAEAGHTPPGARARLVDAVLDTDKTEQCSKLEATIPLGDVEALEQLRARCDDVQTRPAGATCLVDAKLPDTD
jgi:hypothetical protein